MNFKPVRTGKSVVAISALAIIASVTFAGCAATTADITTKVDEQSQANNPKNNATNPKIQEQYVVMFAQMMIPHHQQAVDMGKLAETRASSAAVKELAAKIAGEQAPEVTMMQGWIDAAGTGADMNMGHMPMGGMLTEAQMAELKAASGATFDKLYLTDMIAHHQGAVKMAKLVIKANTAKLMKLAKSIVKSQTAEIDYMKSLLAK